ncbi:MAG: LytTR family DNA-binding domain-containing protein [Chitinophagaceae bacterium]
MQNHFFIRINGKYLRINITEILYVEGCKNYIKIVTEKKTHLVLITMKRMEQLLPIAFFRRIHKSFIVSLDRIIGFDGSIVYLKEQELPIGQQYKGELEKAVTIFSDLVNEPIPVNTFYAAPLMINGKRKNSFFEAG